MHAHAHAQAAEVTSQPAGFADLVAKVKPAVISVRVKINEAATGTDEHAQPFQPSSPLEKFFRQFGLPGAPNGQRPRMMTGEGSGFFISSDGYAVTNNHVGGKAVSKPQDVRNALAELHKEGKHTVLMRVRSADATKFVAMPLA